MKNKQKKQKKEKTGLSLLMKLIERKSKFLGLAKVLTSLSTILKLIQFWLIYKIIRSLVYGQLTDTSLNYSLLKNYALLIIAVGLTYSLLRYLASRLAHSAAFEIIHTLKLKLISHLNEIHLGLFNKMSLGEIDKIVMNDADKIESSIAHHQMDIIELSLTIPFLFIYLFTVDITMAIAVLIPMLIGFLIISLSLSSKSNKHDQKILHTNIANVQTEVVEYIEGMNDIKCYDIGDNAMEKYKSVIENLSNIIVKISRVFASKIGLYYALIGSSYMTLTALIFYRYMNGFDRTTLLCNFILFLIVSPILKESLESYMLMGKSMKDINEAVARINHVLSIPTLKEPKKSKSPCSFDLEFENVSFSYDEKPVLNNISFTVPHGSKLGIIGSSGGGKTTIAKLIVKFLVPQSGIIKLGGVDLSEISTESLMDNMSFVFQESYLFQDTILYNLTMGKDIKMEKIIHLCKLLNIHTKICSLEKGYETVVGKEDGFFSGGEIQRIAVARILLKNSKIIVLDEATASADTENELYMQKAFHELAKDKTVIIIAHRLKTIENTDKIIVVENGHLVESGTHNELIQKKGRYLQLYHYANSSENITLSGNIEEEKKNA